MSRRLIWAEVTGHEVEPLLASGGYAYFRLPEGEELAPVPDLLEALRLAHKQREHFGCPQCDGSGAYPDSNGEAVQCQACGEWERVEAAIKKATNGS